MADRKFQEKRGLKGRWGLVDEQMDVSMKMKIMHVSSSSKDPDSECIDRNILFHFFSLSTQGNKRSTEIRQ